MDIIAPIPIDKQIIDAILKGQHDLLQEIRDRGQLLPLGTMITLYEGSEWRSRMPILMFIIYNGLQKGLESQIYRILKVFLDGLELGDRCTLLNSPYQIIGNPKPLQEESEGYVSDQGSEIKTTPLSWLMYLATKFPVYKPCIWLCLRYLQNRYNADITLPFYFVYNGRYSAQEKKWIEMHERSILYTVLALQDVYLGKELVDRMFCFHENDKFPFFNLLKNIKNRERYDLIVCFRNMLQNKTITKEEILKIDPEAERLDVSFLLMIKSPCLLTDDIDYIIQQLALFGFNPFLRIQALTQDELEKLGLDTERQYPPLTAREIAEEKYRILREKNRGAQSNIGRIPEYNLLGGYFEDGLTVGERVFAAERDENKIKQTIDSLKKAEQSCLRMRGNTVLIHQALNPRGLPVDVQDRILSMLPYNTSHGTMYQARNAVLRVESKRREVQSDGAGPG